MTFDDYLNLSKKNVTINMIGAVIKSVMDDTWSDKEKIFVAERLIELTATGLIMGVAPFALCEVITRCVVVFKEELEKEEVLLN